MSPSPAPADLAEPASVGFGPTHLPYGVFCPRPGSPARVGVRLGTEVVDVAALAGRDRRDDVDLFAQSSLNALVATGFDHWTQVRAWLLERAITAPRDVRYPLTDISLLVPIQVADYVDFYASRLHAEHAGRILRPGTEPLTPNWLHQPIGYHGRAGSVVLTGADVRRPHGQLPPAEPGDRPGFGPTRKLDFEAELAFVLGGPTEPGRPIPIDAAEQHLFGVLLLDDWSARDVQAFEGRPLGPFLAKSFATSVGAWVTPLAALAEARISPPRQQPEPLPYLRAEHPWALDIELAIELNRQVLSRPNTRALYWTPAQMLTHLTVNGARVRPGDLIASGTVSGPGDRDLGCLLELAWGGSRPLPVVGGQRTWLLDGDTVTLSGHTRDPDGRPLRLGEVSGTIRPAQPLPG